MTSPSPYTCAGCHVVFSSGDAQRDHYRSDWHRYNLRRKVAELPPLTEAAFMARAAQQLQVDGKAVAPKAEVAWECTVCRKHFSSEGSRDTHLKSAKHREMAAKAESEEVIKEVSKNAPSTAEDPTAKMTEEELKTMVEEKWRLAPRLAETDCLFCSHRAETFESNMAHMTREHSLYIPDLEFCADIRGLIAYLGEQIAVLHECIYCPSTIQPFGSLEAVRAHMRDRCHNKIRFDDESLAAGLGDYYDYTPTYPAMEICSDDEDSEYEEIEDDEEMELAIISQAEHEAACYVTPDETEMILPSGARLGHRRFLRYYKQNLTPSVRHSRDRELVANLMDEYRQVGVLEHLPTRRAIEDQRHEYDRRKQHDLTVGMKSNKMQKYFRYQLL